MPTQEMPMHYVNREEWEAKPSLSELTPLEHPIKYVRLSFTREFRKCSSNKKCTKRVKELQEYDMTESKLPDIRPNFVVGGDGFVYEGRGWRAQPPDIKDRPDLNGKFIEITYIGDYSKKPPPNEMLFRSYQAMTIGVTKKFLDPEFEVLRLGGPEYEDPGHSEPRF